MIYKVENDIITKSTYQELYKFVSKLQECGVDTETRGFDPHTCNLLSIQFGNLETQFLIDCEKEQHLKRKLEIIFKLNKLWLFQNAKFDLRFLYHLNIRPDKVYDTFLAECVLYMGYNFSDENKPHYIGTSLKALAKKYCNIDLDKTIRGNIHKEGLSNNVILYAINDVKYLSLIKDKQLTFIKEKQLEVTLDLENRVVKVFAKMEYDGVKIDTVKWNEVANQINKELVVQKEFLNSIVISEPKLFSFVERQLDMFSDAIKCKVNWSSATQKKSLINKLGLEVDATNERELMRVRAKHIIIKELLNYNKKNKLSTSFGKKFLTFVNRETNRIHYNIWQILQTGRISIEKPNVNQIPSKGELGKIIRSCFIPEEGNVIVGGDYSGMELRIIAEFSKDKLWVDAFNEGKDLHSVLCAATFNILIEDVKKESHYKAGVTYRDIQKTINFGLAYGMSKFKLADTMDIDVDTADNIIKKFFSIVPDVDKFLTMLGELAKKRGYIRTNGIFKRIRSFPEWLDAKTNNDFTTFGKIERAGKNTPIQGTNGDIIKLALINIQDEIWNRNLPIKIILSVYDEIRTECPKELAEEWKIKMNQLMEEAAKVVIKSVPIVVDCSITECWEK